MDSLFTNLLGEDRLLQLTDYFYGGSSQEFWSVQEVINSGNVSRLPKVSVYLMIIIPVSYTHLDVYKRQVIGYVISNSLQGYNYGTAVTAILLVFIVAYSIERIFIRIKKKFTY